MHEFTNQQYQNDVTSNEQIDSCCLNGLNIVNAIYQTSKGVILKQVGSLKIGGFDDVFLCHIRVAVFQRYLSNKGGISRGGYCLFSQR